MIGSKCHSVIVLTLVEISLTVAIDAPMFLLGESFNLRLRFLSGREAMLVSSAMGNNSIQSFSPKKMVTPTSERPPSPEFQASGGVRSGQYCTAQR